METAIFTCSICGEDSREICRYCTKDACGNHLCERCHRCSDCCHCDLPLTKAYKEERRAPAHVINGQPPPDTAVQELEQAEAGELDRPA